MRHCRHHRAFSLFEVLVCIVLLGIISVVCGYILLDLSKNLALQQKINDQHYRIALLKLENIMQTALAESISVDNKPLDSVFSQGQLYFISFDRQKSSAEETKHSHKHRFKMVSLCLQCRFLLILTAILHFLSRHFMVGIRIKNSILYQTHPLHLALKSDFLLQILKIFTRLHISIPTHLLLIIRLNTPLALHCLWILNLIKSSSKTAFYGLMILLSLLMYLPLVSRLIFLH